jgi:hypothetical protein
MRGISIDRQFRRKLELGEHHYKLCNAPVYDQVVTRGLKGRVDLLVLNGLFNGRKLFRESGHARQHRKHGKYDRFGVAFVVCRKA